LQDAAWDLREEGLQGGQAERGTRDVLQEVEDLVPRQHVDLQAVSAAGLRFAQRFAEVLFPGTQGPWHDLEERCGSGAGDAFGRELFGEARGIAPRLPFGQTLGALRLSAACAAR